MKILTKPSDIRQAVKDIKPEKIAVAFLGNGWNDYICSWDLIDIVLSPTVGSNPKAIELLMKDDELGHESVHFLDDLHAKIYIGKNMALLGSCNLSRNGMGDKGLREAAVLIEDKSQIKELESIFEQYKKLAKQKYPNHAAKLKRLRLLQKQWDKAVKDGDIVAEGSPSLAEYASSIDEIRVAWYTESSDIKLNVANILAEVPEAAGRNLGDYFHEYLLFDENDDIKVGEWILCWRCDDAGLPTKNGSVGWMQVDLVIPCGADEFYSKMACQIKPLKKGIEPFRIGADKETKKIIRDALSSGKFNEFLSLDDSSWRLPTSAHTRKFIQYIHEQAALQNSPGVRG